MSIAYRRVDGRTVTRVQPDERLEASPRWARTDPPNPEPDERRGPQGFPCGDCDFVSVSASGLRAHRGAKHPEEEE